MIKNFFFKEKYILLILISFLISIPHFFTSNELWDGTILRFAIENKNYEILHDFFNETNISIFVLIYYVIAFFYDLSNFDISYIFNISSILIIIFSVLSFNFFLINALNLNKDIAIIISSFVAMLPYYALLNSSLLFFSILNPSIIFFAIGLVYKKKYLFKSIGYLLLIYTSIYPLMIPFSFSLIIISLIINNKNFFIKKYFPVEIYLFACLLIGMIIYSFLNNKMIAIEYKPYLDKENVLFGLTRFNEYLSFFYIALILPTACFVQKLFKSPLHTLLLIFSILILIIVSTAPYIIFNKQPICLIDYNCKENIYGFKERHTILLFLSLMIYISIGINFIMQYSYKAKAIFIIMSLIILFYTLLPYHILNHNRNLIRQEWMHQLLEATRNIPSEFNYIQLLMPNDDVLYRLRNYDIQYLISKSQNKNTLFQVNLVDSRVPDRTHKDYFIVPNEPNFNIKMDKIRAKIADHGLNSVIRNGFISKFETNICGARYKISTSITNKKNGILQEYFNVKLSDVYKWMIPFKVDNLEVNLELIEKENCH